jgi:polyhydroxyalkanoate synthase
MVNNTTPTTPMHELAELTMRFMDSIEAMKEVQAVEVGTTPKTKVYEQGKLAVYRYDRATPATVKTPLLIVYALVNRFEMMDLQPDRSLIRKLLDLGLDIYVIDWGYADRSDAALTMNDYVNGYILDSVRFVARQHGLKAINILGVCQGGAFSLMFSALHPERVRNLITMVTPVDFDVTDGLLNVWAKRLDFDRVTDAYGAVSGEFLNVGFLMLKPFQKLDKYMNFLSLDSADKMTNFLRMEKWVFDSPNQAGECYRQYMKELYQQNRLIKGTLVLGGKPVLLSNIKAPLLNIYAAQDHIVPPSSTKPLNDLVGSTDKQLYEFPGGHIGVFTGSRSQKELAPTIHAWLRDRE